MESLKRKYNLNLQEVKNFLELKKKYHSGFYYDFDGEKNANSEKIFDILLFRPNPDTIDLFVNEYWDILSWTEIAILVSNENFPDKYIKKAIDILYYKGDHYMFNNIMENPNVSTDTLIFLWEKLKKENLIGKHAMLAFARKCDNDKIINHLLENGDYEVICSVLEHHIFPNDKIKEIYDKNKNNYDFLEELVNVERLPNDIYRDLYIQLDKNERRNELVYNNSTPNDILQKIYKDKTKRIENNDYEYDNYGYSSEREHDEEIIGEITYQFDFIRKIKFEK